MVSRNRIALSTAAGLRRMYHRGAIWIAELFVVSAMDDVFKGVFFSIGHRGRMTRSAFVSLGAYLQVQRMMSTTMKA